MKVGIFNEYFNTMGGGEKHIGAIAEYLVQNGHEVQLITFEEFDLRRIEKKLNLNLSGCSILLLDNHYEVEEFSKNYDIFINASYQCSIKPKARKNLILTFFPVIPKYRWVARFVFFQRIIRLINQFSNDKNYVFQSGFYSFEKTGRYSGNWTKQNFSIRIKSFSNDKWVEIILHLAPISHLKVDGRVISARFRTSNIPLELIECHPKRIVFQTCLSKGKDKIIDFFLSESFKPEDDPRSLGIFIEQVEIKPKSFLLDYKKNKKKEKKLLQCSCKGIANISLVRLLVEFFAKLCNLIADLIKKFFITILVFKIGKFLVRRVRDYDYLEYYDLILANSKYTQRWIKKYWGRESKILYPRVDVEEFFNNEEKENKIISVGRFFKGGHSKKQLAMVKVFKKMVANGLQGWEYHLCGGSHQLKVHQEYLDKIRKEAKGYPIFIHSDISFSELKKLYAKSSIFWHAAGYGEDEDRNPDKFEHFGITAVEAMASGCIPIVINKAGQKEVVTEGKNGFLWDTLEELAQKTLKVISLDDKSRNALRNYAVESSKNYSKKRFQEKLKEIFSLILPRKH